jgi:hypothetical protein
MVSRSITYYLDGRHIEWGVSAYLFAQGVEILGWPASAHGSILLTLVGNIGAMGTALLFIIIGIANTAALIANGRSLKIGPHARSLIAIIRMVIWASFSLSMYRVSMEQWIAHPGTQFFLSPMALFFGFFTIAEAYTPYRAVLDVRTGS